ncbi:MAG TPA: hypothetical protein VIP77_24920 [Jiangellaceae bacterium]
MNSDDAPDHLDRATEALAGADAEAEGHLDAILDAVTGARDRITLHLDVTIGDPHLGGRLRQDVDAFVRHVGDEVRPRLKSSIRRDLLGLVEAPNWQVTMATTGPRIYVDPSADRHPRGQRPGEPLLNRSAHVVYRRPAEPWSFWPDVIEATTTTLQNGGDEALAAVVSVIAHRDPDALRRMLRRDGDNVRIDFPGGEPINTSTMLPHRDTRSNERQPRGGLSTTWTDHPTLGSEFIAKGARAALSRPGPPEYRDPRTTPLAARVTEAMELATGHRITWETPDDPVLDLDDDTLAAILNDSYVAVACSWRIGRGHPDFEHATRCAIFTTGSERAYAVLGVDQHDNVVLRHPIGHLTSLSLADFRKFFPDLIRAPRVVRPRLPEPTPEQMDNLARELER